jgi:TolB protein
MIKLPRILQQSKTFAALAALCTSLTFGEDISSPIDVTAKTSRTIPISLSGYPSEIEQVLSFDLSVVGFDIVSAGKGQFELRGSADPAVKGALLETGAAQPRFSRIYAGGGIRTQAHALADDVVKEVLKLPGIARTRIAYRSATGERGVHHDIISEIYVSDYDGANSGAITQDHSIAAAPCWVPGQLKVLYTSYRSGYPDIYTQDLTTGTRSLFARYNGLNTSAAVSPDGTKVAMILSRTGSPSLWVANIDGSNPKQLTKTPAPGYEASPCWSPDSRTICFTSTAEGKAQLYTISPSGGTMTRLRTGGILQCTEPDWSPDGKYIAFTRATGEFTIYVVPSGGGDAQPLVAGEDPCWSPNSRTIVFTRGRDPSRRLSLLDVPTRRVKDVTRISGSCSQPSWTR